MVKGTVRENLSEPPFHEANARLALLHKSKHLKKKFEIIKTFLPFLWYLSESGR